MSSVCGNYRFSINANLTHLSERDSREICSITLHQIETHQQIAALIVEDRHLRIAECDELRCCKIKKKHRMMRSMTFPHIL